MTADYEPLSAQDVSFLMFESPTTPMHVGAVAVFRRAPGSELGIERLRAYVASRLPGIPAYRRRLASTPLGGRAIWVDDPAFDLAYHVRHVALPAPGSEAQHKELVGRIFSQPLDRSRPLWEMWMVDALPEDAFAVVTKVHHCMVDGVSGVALMAALYAAEPSRQMAEAAPFRPRPLPARASLAVDEIARGLAAPLRTARTLRRALRDPADASERLLTTGNAVWQALSAGFRTARGTPLNGTIGAHRRVEWCSLPLEEVKEICKQLGGTVNDVVLAVVAGALRRFLKARGFRPGATPFRVTIPVNVRSGAGDAAAANRVSALFVDLPLGEPDPAVRLARIRRRTAREKASGASEGIEALTRLADWVGSDVLTFWGTRLATSVRPYNLIVTNVPGPQFPLYLLDARQESIFPQLPLFAGQGAAVAVMSYLGRVHFGLVGDWDLLPDLHALADGVEEAFRELLGRAAGLQTVREKRGRAGSAGSR